MKVVALWYGGPSYATPSLEDAEEFPSLRCACRVFESRADRSDSHFPCVEEPEMQVYLGTTAEELRERRDPYPDRILTLGPRGGVRIERA